MFRFNPIKPGGSESMCSLCPPRKSPWIIDIGLTRMCIVQFLKASSLKKNRPITLIGWKKCQKNDKNTFLVLNKYQNVRCFYIHFSRAFSRCSFYHKKVIGYFRFYFSEPLIFKPIISHYMKRIFFI